MPKRWARRAVSRNLVKRQIYALGDCYAPRLAEAAHLVRLRAAFNPTIFKSASSELLKQAVHQELLVLFEAAIKRNPRLTVSAEVAP